MPDWLSVAVLGLVEGLTEFLPVSSTGHLLLAETVLPRQSDLFNVVIQSGAVLAVGAVFTGRLVHLATTLDQAATRTYLGQLAAAFGLTAVGGLAIKHLGLKLPETPGPVAWATLVGGVLFIAVERWLAGRPQGEQMTWAAAIAVGAGQLVAAIFPGASRSGTTILVALALGVRREQATEFSFLLGIPTLLAAGAVQVAGALRDPAAPPPDWGMLALGAGVAAVTAFAVVRWLLGYVRRHSFVPFGIYRIVLGIVTLLAF